MLEDYLKELKKEKLSVLDMGTGSGILALAAAISKKVSRVVFADTSISALKLARQNLDSNQGLVSAECSFVKTDLFSKIPKGEKFDIIMFNPPYLPQGGEKADMKKTWYGGKDGMDATIKFLEHAKNHLNNSGAILLVWSSFANTERLLSYLSEHKIHIHSEKKIHIFFEDIFAGIIKKQ